MWRILLEEFWGDLVAQKTRALLTTFAVVWGSMSVVLLLAFGGGLKHEVTVGLLNAGEKMFMIWGNTTSEPFDGLPRGRRIHLTEQDLTLLERSIPQIDLVSPSYGRSQASLEAGGIKTNTYMEGVYPTFGEMRHMYPQAGGRFLDAKDLKQRRRSLFLGDSIAAHLFPEGHPVGRTVNVDGLPFTVVGVMEDKFQDSQNNGPDSRRAIIPASTFQAIYGDRYVNHLLIRPRSVEDAPLVKREIFRVLGERYRFAATDSHALSIWDFIEDARINRAIGLGIQIFLGLVGAFTLIVAGVGLANVMVVAVRERTPEIGIKLALGARRRHIVAQFVFEALLLALAGGLLGLAVASLIVLGVDAIPSGNSGAMVYLLNPRLSWPVALTCVGILVAIGLAAGILPARRAAAVDPVESLRYE